MSQPTFVSHSRARAGRRLFRLARLVHAGRVLARRASAVALAVIGAAVLRAAVLGIAVLGVTLSVAVIRPSTAWAQAPACNRACLEELAERYMAALVAREPAKLPWAEHVRSTENEVPLMIGDGAWGTVTKIDEHPYIVADPASGNVLWYGVVEEHGQPAYFGVRLGIDRDGKIAEVESVAGREGTPMPFAKTDGYTLDARYSAPLAADQRAPRERLIALADGYYNTLQLNDGQLFTAFDPACRRITNGVEAAGSCQDLFENGFYKPVDRVRARRFPIVDEERGVVVAFAFLDHAARYTQYRTVDGAEHEIPVEYPNTHVVLELLKLENGKVDRIEGVGAFLPYLMPTRWRQ